MKEDQETSFDVVVVGGGPAGLFAASQIRNKSVLLLEKKPRPGLKLLISGSGRCNVTHAGSIRDFFDKYHEAGRFLRPALLGFTNEDLCGFLGNNGTEIITDENGKVFPASGKASGVLDMLIRLCRQAGVEIIPNRAVNGIIKEGDNFVLSASRHVFRSRYVIIATGGRSYPLTGSTGDGYSLAAGLGHTIVSPREALTPVNLSEYSWAHLSGNSIRATITVMRNTKRIVRSKGVIGFSSRGLTGPGILDISRHISTHDILLINFTELCTDEAEKMFLAAVQQNGKQSVLAWVRSLNIPRNLAITLCTGAGADHAMPLAGITRTLRKDLLQAVTNYPVVVSGTGGWNTAMATAGGIALDEVNPKTMESKRVPGLFFAGEVLDIDGQSGGYNLQAAFSTGFSASRLLSNTLY